MGQAVKKLMLPLLLLSFTLFAQSYQMIVHNPNSQDLTDFQVRAKLPSDLVGKPITIKDLSGNSVPFCYETSNGECTTDPAQGDGYIWVKVPSIPANGDAKLLVESGTNGAVEGDQVFDFYDDFNYPNGPFDGAGKWKVNRYSGDTSTECVIENGILWLVKKSEYKGCNIRASNFNLKYYQKVVIEFKFKVDYACGEANDGDGIALVIDGKDDEPYYGCHKGFYTLGQGIDIVIYTNDFVDGYVGIANGIDSCTPGSSAIDYLTLSSKSKDLDEGIVTVKLTGSKVLLHYEDLDPADGLKSGDVEADLWDPDGYGYFMIGAGTSLPYSASIFCVDDYDGSAHGIDWIRVRKYAPQEPTVSIALLKPGVRLRLFPVSSVTDTWTMNLGSTLIKLAGTCWLDSFEAKMIGSTTTEDISLTSPNLGTEMPFIPTKAEDVAPRISCSNVEASTYTLIPIKKTVTTTLTYTFEYTTSSTYTKVVTTTMSDVLGVYVTTTTSTLTDTYVTTSTIVKSMITEVTSYSTSPVSSRSVIGFSPMVYPVSMYLRLPATITLTNNLIGFTVTVVLESTSVPDTATVGITLAASSALSSTSTGAIVGVSLLALTLGKIRRLRRC